MISPASSRCWCGKGARANRRVSGSSCCSACQSKALRCQAQRPDHHCGSIPSGVAPRLSDRICHATHNALEGDRCDSSHRRCSTAMPPISRTSNVVCSLSRAWQGSERTRRGSPGPPGPETGSAPASGRRRGRARSVSDGRAHVPLTRRTLTCVRSRRRYSECVGRAGSPAA